MATPTFFSDGHTPDSRDTQWRIAQKILGAVIDGGGGGGGGSGGNSDGVVDPVAAPTVTTVTNYYANTATGTLWVWPANGAAWKQLV